MGLFPNLTTDTDSVLQQVASSLHAIFMNGAATSPDVHLDSLEDAVVSHALVR